MFQKYRSIENTNNVKHILEFTRTCRNDEIEVTEKLDGANFGFVVKFNSDGKVTDCLPAKRTQICGTDFMGCGIVVENYTDKAKALAQEIRDAEVSIGNPVKAIQIYGELLGNKINGRVKYLNDGDPHREFVAFDIMIIESKDKEGKFFDKRTAKYWLTKHGFKYPHVFAYTDLETAMNWNPEFISVYNPIEGNYAEGVVVCAVHSGNLASGKRAMTKLKSDQFKEKEQGKAKKNKKKTDGRAMIGMNAAALLDDELIPRLCKNRLDNAIGNLAPITPKCFGRIVTYLKEDIYKDSPQHMVDALSEEEKQLLNKLFHPEIAKFIKQRFLDEIGRGG